MEIQTCEKFLDEAGKHKDIIIYGAGWAGKLVYGYLKIHNIQISSFAVTKRQDMEKAARVQVMDLEDALSEYPEAFIILGVLPDKQKEMQDCLKAGNVTDYAILAEPLLYEMRQEVLAERAEHMQFRITKADGQLTVGYLDPGYLDTDYAEQRLIIGRVEGAGYAALPKELKKISCTDGEYGGRMSDFKMAADASYCPGRVPAEVDIIHVFNMVCMTDRPWIASFETCLPRIPLKSSFEKEYYQQLSEAIISGSCKGILALCRNAYDIHCSLLRENLPADTAERIIKKTGVLHPPQEILIPDDAFEHKHDAGQVHFIFVGNAFFIKGGREMLKVLSSFENRYDFKLTLISSLQIHDYFTHAAYEDKVGVQEIIKSKKWIEHYVNLPNDSVLEKCREAAVGLLPSMADTYGYAVLEMQAAGCPVITTNVRAFPEINSEECGWICHLPVNGQNMCSNEALPEISQQLELELTRCISDILENPHTIREKGRKAMEKIRRMHNPKTYSDTIRSLIN